MFSPITKIITKSLGKNKKFWGKICRSALLLSFCEKRLCLLQLLKKLNSTERGALFRHFCVSKVITTAHAHKSGVIFHFFPRACKQKKIKALRLKMTKIASRGGPALRWGLWQILVKNHFSAYRIWVHQKEDLSENISWKYERNWTPWKRVM